MPVDSDDIMRTRSLSIDSCVWQRYCLSLLLGPPGRGGGKLRSASYRDLQTGRLVAIPVLLEDLVAGNGLDLPPAVLLDVFVLVDTGYALAAIVLRSIR